jgi:hypothetical protein
MPAMDTGELNRARVTPGQFEDTQEWPRKPIESSSQAVTELETPRKLERVLDEPVESAAAAASGKPADINQLSPEMIDAIARRAVEQLSERVVQQIAWEVVPQLAELMIKRKLEEQESQPK